LNRVSPAAALAAPGEAYGPSETGFEQVLKDDETYTASVEGLFRVARDA
jgi:hypothetical protein